jgi:beta-mannosidase
MHTQSLTKQWQFREAGTDEWLPAQVPGSVQTDLLALGRIPDPFVADNELHVQWITDRDWEYRLVLQADPETLAEKHIFLVCNGLDTLADVTLNGKMLGHAENAFRQYRWDVKTILAEGENELLIAFPSPMAAIRPLVEAQPLRNPTHSLPGGPYLRKAPCQFGWDWGPKLPPVGIWKDVRLEGYSVARLYDVHLRQQHDDRHVAVSAGVSVARWKDADLCIELCLIGPDGQEQEAGVKLTGDEIDGTATIDVADPQAWWPNGLGPQPLYDVQVNLLQGDVLLDRRTFKMGLRTVELRQEPDEFGTSFTFVVNGVPIFAKGANWIPADSFPTRISDGHLEHLIRSAAQAHMNMLRVWGGGLYEEERFYDLCDRYGILVWQDFCFSCSVYPDDEKFVENVRVEAVENVRRLRHRTSLALWCGNNEMEIGWVGWGWEHMPESERFKQAYGRMFHHLLPEICAAEDPDRPYWPSSPSSNTPFVNPDSLRAGDTHNWAVWHGNRPFEAYREHDSRFVSEFGFQSLPCLDTVRTYADEADWNMTSYIMEHHQRNDAGNGKIINYMTDHFRMPKDFPSLVYVTQVLQAKCVRTGVEYWRRNRRCTSGALYWQLNDCWPVASWASLDYFGRWKALHYAARRFNAPMLLSAEQNSPKKDPSAASQEDRARLRWSLETPEGEPIGDGERFIGLEMARFFTGGRRDAPKEWKPEVALFLTNDTTVEWQGTVRWSLETLVGEVLADGEEAVTVPAVSAAQVCEMDFTDQVDVQNRREVVLVYELWQGDERLSLGVVPFLPDKHLALTDPDLHYTIGETDEGIAIEVTAQRLARFVWLEIEGADVVFSDNYFDLPAKRTTTVTLPAIEGWSLDRVRRALRIRSLVDSF